MGLNMKFPECWEDDVRMSALFSPFRIRSVNPENYDSKVNFWKNMILEFCVSKGSADFNLKELRMAFQRKNKLPYGLQTVIDEMVASKEIRLKTMFMNDPTNGWYSWAVDSFVKRPLGWGFQRLKQTVASVEENQPTYVHLDLIEKQTNELSKNLEPHSGKVLFWDEITKIGEEQHLNKEGLTMLLHYLHSTKKLYLEYKIENNEKEIHLIKVPSKSSAAEPLTDMERSILSLEQTEKNLIKMIDDIETEAKLNDDMARKYVKEGKRLMAKGCLKKKHLLEKKIEKRSIALENIQTLLARIHDSESDGVVFNAYKLGSQAMKSLLSDSGIDCDKVDEVMADIKDAFEIHDEMQASIANAAISDIHDDTEIEDELAELLSEDTKLKSPTPANPVPKPQPKSNVDEDLLRQLENLEILNTVLTSDTSRPNKTVEN